MQNHVSIMGSGDNETKLSFYVSVNTTRKLSSSEVKNLYHSFKETLPNGTMTSITRHGKNGREPIILIGKSINSGRYLYQIPLTRNLAKREKNEISEKLNNVISEGFMLEFSESLLSKHYDNNEKYNPNKKYQTIIDELSKDIHQSWLSDMQKHGWRFGVEFNQKDKTTPLLIQWEQLPKTAQEPNLDLISRIINTFKKNGFRKVV